MAPYTSSNAFSPRGTQLQYEVSGSVGFQPVLEMKQLDFSGTKLDLADVTNYNSGIFKEWLATLLDSGEINYKANFLPGDASQQQFLIFFNSATLVTWRIVLPNNPTTGLPYGHFQFNAYITGLEWLLPIEKEAGMQGKLKITGAINFVPGF